MKMTCTHAISDLNNKLSQGLELLVAGDIDANDYKKIKSSTEDKIIAIEEKLTKISKAAISMEELDMLLEGTL